jgi:acetyl-CoA carboxylase biotin carboxylase subunit
VLFDKVLIANRGEIAMRVARTCARLGVKAVGLYSDDDAHARHLEMVTEAVHLPGSTPAETYLDRERVLEAARSTGCQAVHPGYGFLAEHAGFARRCEESGLVFIGPSSHHIELMGEKRQARDAFERMGFPVLPHFAVEDGHLPEAAHYPIILKASAGGGGIGMTLVHEERELERAIKRVRSAGARYFGSEAIYAERYLPGARHVEVQVAGDGAGAVQLGERDCSWQRRYQKLVEESPAPGLDPAFTRRLAETAAQAAGKLGYENVGTVECLVAGGEFFFLEMNTRIQVEHAVTEEVYGIDLVEWQLRIASGGGVPSTEGLSPSGHAIELRIYAEDPVTGLPSPGTITECELPAGPGIRVDTAATAGTVLPVHFDPLIAKLIVHAPARESAIARAAEALAATHILGVKVNVPLLQRIVASDAFRSGDYTTHSLADLPKPPA